MSVKRLALLAAPVHWTVKTAPISLNYLDSEVGVPDPSGSKANLREAYRQTVRYLRLAGLIGGCHFIDHSHSAIKENCEGSSSVSVDVQLFRKEQCQCINGI